MAEGGEAPAVPILVHATTDSTLTLFLDRNLALLSHQAGNTPVDLRYAESEYLRLLMSNPRMTYTREALFRVGKKSAYGEIPESNSVDVGILRIRSKLGSAPFAPLIYTHKDIGYSLSPVRPYEARQTVIFQR